MESPKYVKFDKSMTSIVKGFAIIFMLILHGYDDYKYDVTLNYDHAFLFAHGGFILCVGIFAFMVGYGYAFSKTKNFQYSCQHISKVVIPFWVIFLLFMLPVCYKEYFASGLKTMIYTIIGFDVHFYYYNWFVYYFVFAMCIMPLVSRFVDKRPLVNTIIVVCAIYALQVITHPLIIFIPDEKIQFVLINCFLLTPVTVLGYLFAHEGYYERIHVDQLPTFFVIIATAFILFLTIYLESILRVRFGFLFDFFYAPIAIGAIAVFFSKFRVKPFRAVMMKLGWASMYMWFLHSLFHTPPVRWFYQPIITIFNDVNLVVIWTIIVVFIFAWILKSIMDKVMRINK